MFGKKKKKKGMPSHVGLYGKLKKKKEYTNYVQKGGTLTFQQWSKTQ
tara:strand:- start:193 stop:333 length:141 start_codon:yes stop_codon:yes gene_type:complete